MAGAKSAVGGAFCIGGSGDSQAAAVQETASAEDTRLERLKMLLGFTDDEQEQLLLFSLSTAESAILAYINHEALPKVLETVLITMAAGYFKEASEARGVKTSGQLSSVKRGDVTTSFSSGKGAEEGGFLGSSDLFGCKTALSPYRRVRR